MFLDIKVAGTNRESFQASKLGLINTNGFKLKFPGDRSLDYPSRDGGAS